MDGIGERLIKIRAEINLKQGVFADRIKISQGMLSDIEHENKPLTDRNIKLICLEFGVNEDWLRNGNGDMFVKKPEQDQPPPEPARFPTTILDKDGKPLNKEERELLEIYRELIPINQDLIRSNAKVSLASQRNTQDRLESKNREMEGAESKGQTGA